MKPFRFPFYRFLLDEWPGTSVPDGELLERHRQGDASAFELLARRHAEAVAARCARVGQSEGMADLLRTRPRTAGRRSW